MKGFARLSGTWSGRLPALDTPSQYTPSDVQYEDVLDYYGQSVDLEEAWPSESTGSVDILFTDDEFDLYATSWDPSLGPVEIDPEEVAQRLAKKDLDQFDDDEIVSTVERRGMVIGFKKDGSSCILKDGTMCLTLIGLRPP